MSLPRCSLSRTGEGAIMRAQNTHCAHQLKPRRFAGYDADSMIHASTCVFLFGLGGKNKASEGVNKIIPKEKKI